MKFHGMRFHSSWGGPTEFYSETRLFPIQIFFGRHRHRDSLEAPRHFQSVISISKKYLLYIRHPKLLGRDRVQATKWLRSRLDRDCISIILPNLALKIEIFYMNGLTFLGIEWLGRKWPTHRHGSGPSRKRCAGQHVPWSESGTRTRRE